MSRRVDDSRGTGGGGGGGAKNINLKGGNKPPPAPSIGGEEWYLPCCSGTPARDVKVSGRMGTISTEESAMKDGDHDLTGTHAML